MTPTLKEILRPFTLAEGDKLVRLGREMDGGYVLPQSVIDATDALFSGGIGDDTSFERDYSFEAQAFVTMLDHTITLETNIPRAKFSKLKVTPDILMSLSLRGDLPFTMKLDIEGDEYKCLYPCDKWDRKPECLIVEFHWISQNEEKLRCILGKLASLGYKVVHIHGNNHAALTPDGLPDTIEVTFIRGEVGEPFHGVLPLPRIDFPNNPDAPDHVLDFTE